MTISAANKEQLISESTWIVFKAGGFSSECEAWSFGQTLRTGFDLASLAFCSGADTGDDLPTLQFTQEFALASGLIEPDERILPNVHGLSIYEDDGRSRFPSAEITAVRLILPDRLLRAAEVFSSRSDRLSPITFRRVRLFNLALMHPEPISRIVLLISIVEGLAHGEKWSAEQNTIIERIAIDLRGKRQAHGPGEVDEILDAIANLRRVSVRQGVKRVMHHLGIPHHFKEWDRLYGLRSELFHGVRDLPKDEIAALETSSRQIASEVITALLKAEGLVLDC